jgi:hypothetical protein
MVRPNGSTIADEPSVGFFKRGRFIGLRLVATKTATTWRGLRLQCRQDRRHAQSRAAVSRGSTISGRSWAGRRPVPGTLIPTRERRRQQARRQMPMPACAFSPFSDPT